MSHRSVRAGLLGLGAMGRHHARILADLDGVELVGVADPSPSTAATLPSDRVLSSVDDLVKLGIDYCVVAVPTVNHEELCLSLANAGVHVLVEKPLSVDPASSLRITNAFESNHLVGAVGHIERYNPALQEARRRMSDGDLGQILQVSTRRQGPFPARIADVGVVKDLATHDIDLTAWICQSNYETVSAVTAHRSGREHEDMVAVVANLLDGTVTNHLVNWLSPFKERITVITGERGAFVADTLTADLTFHANGVVPTQWDGVANFRGVNEGDVIRYAIAKPEPLRVEHENFRNAVMGLPAEIVTMREGLATVNVAEAILSSARTSTTIKVEWA